MPVSPRSWISWLGRFARAAAIWALAVSATTATVSSIGRTFCLPPYWPPELVLRCRANDLGGAVARLPLDLLMTTLMLFIPALGMGAVVTLLWVGASSWATPRTAAIGCALAGAASWPWLVSRLEPSYLDFIIGWYAVAAGSGVAVIIGARYLPRWGLRSAGERTDSRTGLARTDGGAE